jgi:hypothetical protein
MVSITTSVRRVKTTTRKTVREAGKITRTERVRVEKASTRRTVKPARPAGLIFGKGNAKLHGVATFSLPAGWACPGAKDCLARADRETGKLKDGPATLFRCFSASQEAMYPSVRQARWSNFQLLRGLDVESMADLIAASLPRKAATVRVHVSGDFFSQDYFDAWLAVASRRPEVTFYFYTKSLRFWVARLDDVGTGRAPGKVPNFVPTASRGGREDDLIGLHGLREARVVYSQSEADALGLDVDDDDTHAMAHGGDFALLIHGMQPPGSQASKAVSALRAQGEFGYGERADARRLALAVVN